MEDDDEFGDLYTDVLRPVSSIAPPQPSLFPSASPASAPNPPPDLNIHSDDEDILYGASNPKSSLHSQTISSEPEKVGKDRISGRRIDDASNWNDNDRVEEQEEEKKEDQEEKVLAWVSNVRASNSPKLDVTRSLETGDGELRQAEEARVSETPEHFEKSKTGEAIVEEGDKNGDLMAESDVFLGEEVGEKAEIDVGIDDLESEPIIPGISSGPFIPGLFDDAGNGGGDGPKASRRDDSAGGGDDWDSDSEDDLQIVLNDNSGPIGVDRNGGMGSDDEDEDGEDLVIVADGDQHHQPIEPQEWGEDLAQVADGERKEGDEAVKMNGGMVNALGVRIGYSNHVYHPHHSQFKYVRPGAAAMSGGAMVGHGGAPGQVRPLVNTGPIAGRGRGDWRPIGVKTTTTMQKSFHSGFGLPVWATNSSGRGFGNGLEFTLPPHKTVFDTDIDSFEEKPWRHPGVDTSDFFNFGLDEEKWKDYCKQLEQLRLEATMQSKIRVYESGRSEQDYDPDLPPELAAAVGLHDASLENAQLGKTDGGQSDSMGQGRGAARVRPPIPTGRAIQVEGGYGERLPSIDTRPPRIRDSDAIIEIVLQDSADDSNTDNGALEQPENAPRGDDCKGDPEIEDLEQTDTEYFGDHFPQTYNGRKREMVGRKAPSMGSVHDNINEGDGILPLPPETPLQYHNGPKGRTPVYPGRILGTPHEGRWSQRTVRGRYPQVTAGHGNDMAPSQIDSGKKFSDNQEKSGESINGKQTPESSPITEKASREPSVEHKDDVHNDHVMAKRSTEVEGEEMALDAINPSDNFGDGALLHSVKKQKLSSRVEQPTFQEVGDGDDLRATRSSDNSKARSGSSRDYQKWREGGEEEVVQDGQSRHMGDTKRHREEDEHSFRKRDDYVRDGRHETDRNRLVVKGREDSYHSYPQRDRDPSSAHYLRKKAEDFERPKERDNSVGARQRRDEEAHERRGKNEDAWKREHVEEMGSRHRSKVQESERNDKDEHFHSRKRLENGDWRGRHDKEVGPKHRERDDSLMSWHENLDDPHSKRRKDEDHQRREHAEKEVLHGYRAREETSRRKRERDDVLDQRRRDDQVKVRDRPDDHHSVRHREESWRLRERDERQRLKQSHEDTLSKRGIEEGRGASRSGRGTEDKLWTGNVRGKDESKDLGSDKDQFKDRRRHSEQTKKRDRTEDETLSQHRGRVDFYARDNQINFEERNSRHERSSSRNDRPVNASDRQLLHKERPKENTRKSKESEGGDQNALGPAKRKQEDHSVHQNEKVSMKGLSEQESGKLALGPSDSHDPGQSRSSTVLSKKSHYERESPQQRHSSRKHREAAPSDDEQQNSRRGRSKLERWASHKEKDDNTNAHTSSPSPKVKETNRNNNERSSLASEQPDESAKTVEAVDNHLPLLEDGNIGDLEMKDVDMGTTPGNQYESDKIEEDRHLDTVAKLKKRSERFKLPMPSEKDSTSNRKIESEALPSAKSETAADAEIKQERPARKRRWTSN